MDRPDMGEPMAPAAPRPDLAVRALSFAYGSRSVLRDISFEINQNEMIALLGCNGAGKSTLFRCLLGFLNGWRGEIEIGRRPLSDFPAQHLARQIAYIPQYSSSVFNYTCREVAVMGRMAYMGVMERPGSSDYAHVERVLSGLYIAHLAERSYLEISGGEQQMVMIARALVQETPLLVMDEPTASLDYGNQLRVLKRIKDLCGRGKAVLFSTHHPDHALLYADRVIAIKDGVIVADGCPQACMTTGLIQTLYQIETDMVDILKSDHSKQRVLLPLIQPPAGLKRPG